MGVIQLPAWEFSYVMGMALKRKQKLKKLKINKITCYNKFKKIDSTVLNECNILIFLKTHAFLFIFIRW